MPRFRKRSIVIQADQWFRNGDHPEDYPMRLRPGVDEAEGLVVRYYRRPDDADNRVCNNSCGHIMYNHGWIDTLEGGHIVCPGDWIITGVRGEHYPCKPAIFEATYEPVTEEAEHDD